MSRFFERAKELRDEMVKDRRELHQIPELGLDLPKTKAYIKGKLEEMGLEVKEYGESGLSTLIEGNGPGKTILLRGDMDALPMAEENDLDFAAEGNVSHTCGHDLHAAGLLGTAKMLLEIKDEFPGTVKLMFQPAEEIFKGASMMIEEGILENPKVDAALAIHTGLSDVPGSADFEVGYMSTSSDNFKITVQGKGGHGAYPHTTHDPINAAVEIYNSYNYLIARENPPSETTILTFGQLSAGSSSNIIPDTAVLQGTMRTFNPEIRDKFKKRMVEINEGVEKTAGCKVDLDFFSGTSSIYNDPDLVEEVLEIVDEEFEELEMRPGNRIMASEDFGLVSEEVPSFYVMMNANVEGKEVSHHNPGVLFDEDMLVYGAAYFTTVARSWLIKNA